MHGLQAMAFAAISILAGCVHPSDGRYPTDVAAEQAVTIDAIVERWYDNARSHPACRAQRNRIYSPEGRPRIGELDFFARLRSPVILVFSNPHRSQERVELEADGHGNTYPYEYHTFYHFGWARILYAKDSDYARIWPTEFQLSESAEVARIPSEFVAPESTYLLFANFIEYENPPRLDALVVCELSNPSILPSILGVPAQ